MLGECCVVVGQWLLQIKSQKVNIMLSAREIIILKIFLYYYKLQFILIFLLDNEKNKDPLMRNIYHLYKNEDKLKFIII